MILKSFQQAGQKRFLMKQELKRFQLKTLPVFLKFWMVASKRSTHIFTEGCSDVEMFPNTLRRWRNSIFIRLIWFASTCILSSKRLKNRIARWLMRLKTSISVARAWFVLQLKIITTLRLWLTKLIIKQCWTNLTKTAKQRLKRGQNWLPRHSDTRLRMMRSFRNIYLKKLGLKHLKSLL